MITIGDLRAILADENMPSALPPDLAEHTELALDSLQLVWLLHMVETQHDVTVDPSDVDLEEFTSLVRIHAYLARTVSTQGTDKEAKHAS